MASVPHEYRQVVRLWQRVLIQAFIDAMQRSSKTYDQIIKRKAIDFLTRPRAELAGICLVCGLQMRDVIRAAKQFSDNDCGFSGTCNSRTAQAERIREALKSLQGGRDLR